MESPTQWTWVWSNSGRQWRTGKHGVPQFMGAQSQTRLSDWTSNMLAKREIGKTKGMRLLPSFLPECKQMLKQPPHLPPSTHTHCSVAKDCSVWMPPSIHTHCSHCSHCSERKAVVLPTVDSSRQPLLKPVCTKEAEEGSAETWKLEELDWEIYYLASLSFSTSQKSKDKTKPQLLLIKIKPSHICTLPSDLNL